MFFILFFSSSSSFFLQERNVNVKVLAMWYLPTVLCLKSKEKK